MKRVGGAILRETVIAWCGRGIVMGKSSWG